MRGLESEFQRFTEICLHGLDADQITSAKMLYFTGALAATNRFLSILDSNLPVARKQALLRRMAREAEAFKQSITNAAVEEEETNAE